MLFRVMLAVVLLMAVWATTGEGAFLLAALTVAFGSMTALLLERKR